VKWIKESKMIDYIKKFENLKKALSSLINWFAFFSGKSQQRKKKDNQSINKFGNNL